MQLIGMCGCIYTHTHRSSISIHTCFFCFGHCNLIAFRCCVTSCCAALCFSGLFLPFLLTPFRSTILKPNLRGGSSRMVVRIGGNLPEHELRSNRFEGKFLRVNKHLDNGSKIYRFLFFFTCEKRNRLLCSADPNV